MGCALLSLEGALGGASRGARRSPAVKGHSRTRANLDVYPYPSLGIGTAVRGVETQGGDDVSLTRLAYTQVQGPIVT